MSKIWILVFGALLLVPLAAQAQMIRGVVIEDGTRTPIAGAFVELIPTDAGPAATAHTDSLGAFVLSPARSGTFNLRLTHFAYASMDSVQLAVQRGGLMEIEVRMAHAAIPLEPLVVTTRRSARLDGFYERMQRPGFGRFVSRKDIENRPGARTSDLLRGMPGVDVTRANGRGLSGVNMITMRGGASGRCLANVYIDGLEVQQFPESGVDEMLTPFVLEGVEVYTSFASAPSPFHSRNSCGVVAFWTRSDVGGRWSWRKLFIGAGIFTLLVALTRR
jgi:hypothetical protein